MAWSLVKKLIKGRPYWYARICQRVDGKPRIVQTRYLGTADDLVAAKDAATQALAPREVTLAEFGASAALWDLAQRLDLVETVDRHVPKRSGDLSVGHYLALAAINRAVEPCSKAALADWHAHSAMSRFLPAAPGQLTSQRFWDQFSRISEQQVRAIEQELCLRVVTDFKLDLSLLLFDPTNFFTFIDSFNEAPTLAQRGHSKEGRDSLRILGFALVATTDGPVPLLHDLYPGNRNDVTEFPVVADQLTARLGQVKDSIEDVTVVFDKGNNSQENFDQLAGTPLHFVGSLVPTHYPEMLELPLTDFTVLDHPRLPGVLAFRCSAKVFGDWRTVVITHNPRLHDAQRQTLEREVHRRLKKLRALQARLAAWRTKPRPGKPPTLQGTQKAVDGILRGRHMKDLIQVTVVVEDQGITLNYGSDRLAWEHLNRTLLGKTLVFTDHDDWTDEEIILAYRGQYLLEELHKRVKNPHVLSFRPVHHWTDPMLRVHALVCFVALLMASLLRRDLARQGCDLTTTRLLTELRQIREVALFPQTRRGKVRKPVVAIAKMSALQEDLYARLKLATHVAIAG
jgi:transposase